MKKGVLGRGRILEKKEKIGMRFLVNEILVRKQM